MWRVLVRYPSAGFTCTSYFMIHILYTQYLWTVPSRYPPGGWLCYFDSFSILYTSYVCIVPFCYPPGGGTVRSERAVGAAAPADGQLHEARGQPYLPFGLPRGGRVPLPATHLPQAEGRAADAACRCCCFCGGGRRASLPFVIQGKAKDMQTKSSESLQRQ